jgi:hypothetical protein
MLVEFSGNLPVQVFVEQAIFKVGCPGTRYDDIRSYRPSVPMMQSAEYN